MGGSYTFASMRNQVLDMDTVILAALAVDDAMFDG